MVRRRRALPSAVVFGSLAWLLVACGGQSSNSGDGARAGRGGGSGGSGGTGGGSGGTGGTGGAVSSGGASGSTTGGSGGSSGSAGSAGTTVRPDLGCFLGGTYYSNGSSWPSECNTCFCNDGKIGCTLLQCGGGAGGSSAGGSSGWGGTAGMSGTGGADAGGEGGASSCEYADIGSFCVLGLPIDSGDAFQVGMPLALSLRPAGCYSSSCTELVSSECNYLGMNGEYQISPFVCLSTEGDVCTDDCEGAPTTGCTPGITLEEGSYAITVTGLQTVKFQVPSVVTRPSDLCSPIVAE